MSDRRRHGDGRCRDRTGRARDAGASKEALLRAAQYLFGRKGFERTTIREIGERAGVDAALIARYFGSKADLYIAAVAAERWTTPDRSPYEGIEQMADAVVTRADRHGPGPDPAGLVRSDTSDEIRVRRPGPGGAAPGGPPGGRHGEPRASTAPAAGRDGRVGADRHQPRSLAGMVRGDSDRCPAAELVALVVDALGAMAGNGPER